jgi:excisionase family DNA binding protein
MTESTRDADDLLTYQEAAAVLGTAPAFIERLVSQRRIAHIKIGHFVRLRRCDLDAYIEHSRVSGVGRVITMPDKQHAIDFLATLTAGTPPDQARYFYLWDLATKSTASYALQDPASIAAATS